MAERKQIDWEKVEPEYRAGVRSLRDIAGEFGCAESAIRKKAKELGWDRDLSARIAAKAEAMVRKEEVRSAVRTEGALSETAIVEANAAVQAHAILDQRKDVTRARGVVRKLFEELEGQIDDLDTFEALGELMRAPDANGIDKLNDLYKKVLALPSRVDSAKKLADGLRVLVELERKVLRIKDDTSIEDAAKKFGEAAAMGSMEAYAKMCAGG